MKITGLAAVSLAAFFVSSIASAATVTNLNDTGAGSLRATIAAANPGDTIDFQGGLTGTIVLTSGQLSINKNLVINGPGPSLIAISGNDLSRVFDIESTFTVAIRGLTVTHGLVNSFQGGGIRNFGTLTLENLVISQNQSVGSGGGGISNEGTMILRDSIVEGNASDQLGGGISSSNELTIERVTVQENVSNGAAGGIGNTGALTLTDSVVNNNTVVNNNGAGGGVFVTNDEASAELINVTISGNEVVGTSGFGGGLTSANFNLGVFLTNVTVADNSAANGGGISTFNVSDPALTLVNTLVADNLVGADCSGPQIVDGGNNLVEDNTCGFTGGDDPILGPLAENGGPTQTQALLSGSPAINSANPAACTSADQRGTARQGTCDIGAYEFIATPGTIQFSAVTYEVNENGGSFQATLTRTGGGDGEVSVEFSTSDGTATAGLDYEAVSQTVTFADGDQANQVVTIPILADDAIEADETVNLNLSDPQNGVTIGANNPAVLTIHDAPSGALTDEDCGNRIDDDGDGQVDCNDTDCDSAEICQDIGPGGGGGGGGGSSDGGCTLGAAVSAGPSAWLLWLGLGAAVAGIRRSIRR